MKICIYGASSDAIDKSFIDAGEFLGKTIALNNHSVVFGGGAAGLMGAVARGAHSENGEIIGICPSFFNVDGALFNDCTEMIYTETITSPLAKLMGIKALILKAARSRIIIPELPENEVLKFVTVLAEGEV